MVIDAKKVADCKESANENRKYIPVRRQVSDLLLFAFFRSSIELPKYARKSIWRD